MTYTVIINRENGIGTSGEPVRGVAEEMVQAVKDAARFNTEAGDHVTFQVIAE